MAALKTPHAPTEKWQPSTCGLIDISIDSQAKWHHQGSEITRAGLVKLFASVLSCKNGIYTLTTPSEQCVIDVQDAPFLITAWYIHPVDIGSVIVCEDNLGRHWPLCEHFPLEIKQYKGQWVPYLMLPHGLTARLQRNVYYQWADIAEQDIQGAYLNSANTRYYLT
ncbi:hypothetical protein PCIT_a3464 [Pseudoalteromonas citrea]|uniref:DUF1285 domain-containing protein n=2 Tax=Pseudoalteromonas citrea TaxID=43655 RepID=A0AAD4AH55_9GAMM|nr:hypothetical protein PCIT_a3464 [Pseudoalteromonas citrea]